MSLSKPWSMPEMVPLTVLTSGLCRPLLRMPDTHPTFLFLLYYWGPMSISAEQPGKSRWYSRTQQTRCWDLERMPIWLRGNTLSWEKGTKARNDGTQKLRQKDCQFQSRVEHTITSRSAYSIFQIPVPRIRRGNFVGEVQQVISKYPNAIIHIRIVVWGFCKGKSGYDKSISGMSAEGNG